MGSSKPISPAKLSKTKLRSVIYDPVRSAEAINLVYVTDKEKGIERIRKGKGFTYKMGSKRIGEGEVLSRIKSLVIPPAWNDVWICSLPNGHLQATGIDTVDRKQYRYHPMWNMLRGQTKFLHLSEFADNLPSIRKQIKADMALDGLPMNKVLATIVSLMDHTGIRVGCDMYEKTYGSYGLTTLKNRHVQIKGSQAVFSFRGKKGVQQNITLKSRKLAKIINECRDLPGRELFQYIDENDERKHIDSGMVNNYIKEISGKEFTSKDFRTWIGTLCAVEAFKDVGYCDSEPETKKKIVEVVDIVARRLRNTRTVCRKYYIHPAVIEYYANGTMDHFFDLDKEHNSELSREERALMKMINKVDGVAVAVPVA